jgi:hypothetical protein
MAYVNQNIRNNNNLCLLPDISFVIGFATVDLQVCLINERHSQWAKITRALYAISIIA